MFPDYVTLSAGIDNGDGTYTLTEAELVGLQATSTDDASYTLTVTVNTQDTDTETGAVDINSFTENLVVTIQEVVDGPVDASVLNDDAQGNEDTAIAIDLGTVTAIDDSETISAVTFGNVPTGSIKCRN